MDRRLKDIAEKVYHSVRLSDDDALKLYESNDLLSIGRLADLANRRKNGDIVFYNVNRHINPTNVCAMSCKFCAYSRKPGEEGAYTYEIPEILEKAGEVVAQGATEVHMVGGLHPRWNFEKYTSIVSALHQAFPKLHIKAFTAVELDWMARRDRRSVREILIDLKNAGLGSLPGGGAEIFHPEIREQICDTKTTADDWIEIHRTAHELGMKSNCTMLYGHIEKPYHRVDHMRRLRELQDQTGGFNAFIPLSFQPHENEMGIERYTLGFDDLRTIAIARLYLDNFKNIKSYWVMFGQDIAQLALAFGANDLDGTVTEEKISRMAGGRAGMVMNRLEIESMIRKAGRIPVERDTLYQPVGIIPPQKERDSEDLRRKTESMMYRLEHQDEILEGDAEWLAEHAELDALALCVRERGKKSALGHVALQDVRMVRLDADAKLSESEASLHDLRDILISIPANDALVSFAALIKSITELRAQHPKVKIGIQSLGSVYQITRKSNLSLEQFFAETKKAGCDVFVEDSHRASAGLTNAEIISLHRNAHKAGLKSVARLEIAASFGGNSAPFWNVFIAGLRAFRDLCIESDQALFALAIEPAKDVLLLSQEYMRALSIAKLVAPEIPYVIASIQDVPTMRPALKSGSATKEQPVLKVLPLCAYYGADMIGFVDDAQFESAVIRREFSDSALEVEIIGL